MRSWEESSDLRAINPTTTTPSGEGGSDGDGNEGFGSAEGGGMGAGGGRVRTRIEGGLGESMERVMRVWIRGLP